MEHQGSKINWRYVAETAAVVSVIVTLIFVWYELRQSRAIATAEGIGLARELASNISLLISENPDVWARGCSDEELTTEERVIFFSIVHAVNSQFLYQYARTNQGFGNSEQRTRIPTVIALHLHNFPGFRNAWMEYYGFGNYRSADDVLNRSSSGWRSVVMEQYEMIKETEPERNVDVMLCGR